jgi:hypothetical protein
MKSVSRIALGVALALGGSALVLTSPADAQRRGNRQQQQQTQQPQSPPLQLSREERAVLVPLEAAARGTDRAAQDAALAAARPVLRGADARYAFARYQLLIADQRDDNAMMREAVDVVLESSRVPAEELPLFLTVQAQLAVDGGDLPKAERAYTRLVQLRPNDADVLGNLALIRIQQRQSGLAYLQRAIAARQAAGGQVPESWLQHALRETYDSSDPALKAQSIGIARTLVTAYPTPVNWRNALLTYREARQVDSATQLDIWRLMRAAGALAGERDWYDFANTLTLGGYPAEAKAVLDDGIARRMVDAGRSPFRELLVSINGRISEDRATLNSAQRDALAAATGTPALRTGDAFFGHGRYPEALALYQAALQKGGVDAGLVNMRLGITHAMAGQRAEAEAAFRAITGPRGDLAALWLLWLSRPAS